MARPKSQPSRIGSLPPWVLHLCVYSLLLAAYFLLVLRFLAPTFLKLFQHHRVEYALLGIVVMIVQAVVLETISAFILQLFQRGRK